MESTMNKLILVPTDFSEVCDNAISQAVEAAKFLDHKILLLHVINTDTKNYLKKEQLGIESIEEKLKTMAADIENKAGIKVDYLATEGSIFTTIAEVAKDQQAGLIFLGTHGKLGMQHLTGSFALKVVTSSPAPVIVVQKRPFSEGYKNIVLPITSEAGPWEKTKWAVFIAKQFNATINIFTIAEATPEVKDSAKRIADYLKQNGINYTEKEAQTSGFSKNIIDYSASINADLIMIMTNPDTSFTKFILGTYDEEMIFNAAQIPVMCINPRKFNYKILGM